MNKLKVDYRLVAACVGLLLVVPQLAGAAKKNRPEPGSVELQKRPRVSIPMDPALPDVLIIGDSISLGYTPYVQQELKGVANVTHAPGNNSGTSLGVTKIDAWLKHDRKWTLIHFNWGLHDLKRVKEAGTAVNSDDPKDPQQADLPAYEKNLTALVEKLKATGAKLIFATTTPYPAGVSPYRDPADAGRYNEVALRIMQKNNIPVDDLHGVIQPKLEALQLPKNVHFKPEGSQFLAKQVADSIRAALK